LLEQGLDQWASETAPGEARAVAVQRIQRAFSSNMPELALNGLQIKTLPLEIAYLVQLEQLDLSNNHLTTLPECIGKLQNLKQLDIRLNWLVDLPESVSHLQNLQSLNVSSNALNHIPGGIYTLRNLQKLQLNNNQIHEISDSIQQLINLKELNLSDNLLSTLPNGIGYLQNLEYLNLHSNHLKTLDNHIGMLEALQELYIGTNQLKALPASIVNLGNLNILEANHNQITHLPDNLGKLKNLESLEIKQNQLRYLPFSIGKLIHLEILDISNNQIRALPHSIGRLINLDTLNAHTNQLTQLPDSIKNLAGLGMLDLSHNKITHVSESLGKLGYLEELDLSHNRLFTVPLNLRQGMLLRLNDNPIATIERAREEIIEDILDTQKILDFLAQTSVLAQNEQWALANNTFINQLCIQAHRLQRNDDLLSSAIKHQADILLANYTALPRVKAVISAAEKIDFYFPDEHLIFMSAEGSHGLIVRRYFYEQNLLGVPGETIGWDALGMGKWDPTRGEFLIDAAHNLEEELKLFPLFFTKYMQAQNKLNTLLALSTLNLGPDYQQRFSEALKIATYSLPDHLDKKLTDPTTHQIALTNIFKPLFINDPSIAMLNKSISQLRLTPQHSQALADSLGIDDKNSNEMAALFLCWSALFTNYSSSSIFGSEDSSPWILRAYAAAALHHVQTLQADEWRPYLDITDYQQSLVGNACTATLFGNISSDIQAIINMTDNHTLSRIFHAIIPSRWR
jgi:Leucine-rich repeat (LRR) protein